MFTLTKVEAIKPRTSSEKRAAYDLLAKAYQHAYNLAIADGDLEAAKVFQIEQHAYEQLRNEQHA
jgi:hypothetical protein